MVKSLCEEKYTSGCIGIKKLFGSMEKRGPLATGQVYNEKNESESDYPRGSITDFNMS